MENFKKYSTSTGEHLSPRYRQMILVSGYSVSTAVNWSQHWCALSVFLCFQTTWKVWDWILVSLWCGRTVGRGHGHEITKFSRMGRLPHFLARVELRYYFHEVRYMKSSTFRELSLRSPFLKRIDGINFNPLFHYLWLLLVSSLKKILMSGCASDTTDS